MTIKGPNAPPKENAMLIFFLFPCVFFVLIGMPHTQMSQPLGRDRVDRWGGWRFCHNENRDGFSEHIRVFAARRSCGGSFDPYGAWERVVQ